MIKFAQFFSEKYKKYSDDGTSFVKSHNRETWRGPHEGRELPMMLSGKKPAALVVHDVYHSKFKEHVDSGKFISKPIHAFGHPAGPQHLVKPDYLVGLKGEEYRVNKLHAEFSKPGRDHGKIGRLLGYTKDHIRTWINKK